VTSAKPFEISKRRVLEAYRHVRANQGAAGIDDESIEMFEADLSRNLYTLWNRMASGSYFPPPVKQVEIAKRSGNGTACQRPRREVLDELPACGECSGDETDVSKHP
jgi:retron-type reverse transcriptase